MQKAIADALGVGALSESQQDLALESAGSAIFTAVMMRVLDILPEDKQDELEEITDTGGGPEDLFIYLEKNVPNFAAIIKEEAQKFQKRVKDRKEELMGMM